MFAAKQDWAESNQNQKDKFVQNTCTIWTQKLLDSFYKWHSLNWTEGSKRQLTLKASSLPFCDAVCRGVNPFLFRKSRWAPPLTSATTISTGCDITEAKVNGVSAKNQQQDQVLSTANGTISITEWKILWWIN